MNLAKVQKKKVTLTSFETDWRAAAFLRRSGRSRPSSYSTFLFASKQQWKKGLFLDCWRALLHVLYSNDGGWKENRGGRCSRTCSSNVVASVSCSLLLLLSNGNLEATAVLAYNLFHFLIFVRRHVLYLFEDTLFLDFSTAKPLMLTLKPKNKKIEHLQTFWRKM